MTDAQPEPHDAVSVPPDASTHTCAHCGRPFGDERHLALHRGLAHPGVLEASERAAYRSALADEEADLRRFRIVALGLLVLVYFGFLFAYALFA